MIDFRALCEELHAAFNTYAVDMAHHDLLERARAALAEQPVVPTPIPVAERPPKPGELCWWLEPDEDDGYGAQWSLFRLYGITDPYTHWLPANAIPVPTND